jgi:hypothetical protein
MTRETARSSSAFNFRVDKVLGEKRGQDATTTTSQSGRQIAQFYVQRSSGFADPLCCAASLK